MTLLPSTVLMVPPDHFQFNHETALSNTFQNKAVIENFRDKACAEFSTMVSQLKEHGIEVIILKQGANLPDAVFPNNWFSIHKVNGETLLLIYPMLTENRQNEVNIEGLLHVLSQNQISVDRVIDLRAGGQHILEGTGSLILDKEHQLLFASLSPRTSQTLVKEVAHSLNYTPVIFDSVDVNNQPIYHTNVMMSIARRYAIVCFDAIKFTAQKTRVRECLEKGGKIIIDITLEQVKHMCGNVLELNNDDGESLLIVSTQAKSNFNPEQLSIMERYSTLIPVHIPTIEAIGGGSVRCMMAEIR